MTVYLLEELHMGACVDQMARFEVMTEARFLRVPRSCPDCTGTPEAIPPGDGFSAALLTVHDASCVTLAAMTRRDGPEP